MAEPSYAPLNSSFPYVKSYQTGYSVSPEVSRNIEKALSQGKLLELLHGVKETVAQFSQIPVSISVAGDSGNGISSFINALRIIGHEEDDSAPTGVVRTTQKRDPYYSSHFPNVTLWDLPGLGVTGQTVESYVQEMQFNLSDLLIIIASEQFSSNHVKLAEAIQRMGKTFYIVWTKVDRDLSTSVLSEMWLLQSIQKNIRENLQKERVTEPPIFLVSNLDPLLHDFPTLRDTLHKDLCSIRGSEPLKTLRGICEKTVDAKVATLKERMAMGCLRSFLGVEDEDDMEECLRAYRLQFGVDDDSLQQVAQSMGTIVTEYTANMKSQSLCMLRKGDWKLRLVTCIFMKMFLFCLPCLRCGVRRMRHERMLLLVAQDTKTILEKILEDSVIPPQI